MQLGAILASLRDLADLELDTLAVAVAAEQSRRDALNLPYRSLPPPEAAASLPSSQPEADPEPRSEVVAFTTRYGRVWHRFRHCPHLRGREFTEHAAKPSHLRLCRVCSVDGWDHAREPPSESSA